MDRRSCLFTKEADFESGEQSAQSDIKPTPKGIGDRMNTALRELTTLLPPSNGRDVKELVEDAVTYIKLLKANATNERETKEHGAAEKVKEEPIEIHVGGAQDRQDYKSSKAHDLEYYLEEFVSMQRHPGSNKDPAYRR